MDGKLDALTAKFKSIEQFGSRSSTALLFGFDGLP